MRGRVVVEPLAWHPGALPGLRVWLEREWPTWYGGGGAGLAEDDLLAFSAAAGLPFGVVALCDGRVCGVAALKAASIASHAHLAPWAAAGLVEPSMRGQGIGSLLLAALECRAKEEGFNSIHCATATAESLLLRRGWLLLDRTVHEAHSLGVYRKTL
ncbi:MAG: GNAT family N-acetyltransferase [Pseudomonadota bacterium]|nr:GNAT family N-acetyltransferase [Pseudomonadota bacterium]